MIDAGETPVEDQQAQNDEAIGKEFLLIQPFRNEQKCIEIIKSDQQDIVQNKKGGKIPLGEEREIPRSRIEYEGYHQEADPGCYVNDQLNDPFFQHGRSHNWQIEAKYTISAS
jgi:hypothetical protein